MQQLARQLIPLLLLVLVSAFSTRSATATERFDDRAMKHIAYPDWFEDSPFHDLREDLHEALADGRQGLMVLFTTEGCSYCDAFIRNSLGDPEIARLVQQDFATVGLEIFDDAEMTDPRGQPTAIKEFAEREGADFSPTLLFYGAQGETLLRIVGYQSPERFRMILGYVSGGHHRSEPLRAYLARFSQNIGKPSTGAGFKPDSLFASPPYQLDRSRIPADRPLLVIFEERDCAACAAFHEEVLASADIRKMLERFEIARFDAADNKTPVVAPDGSRTTPAALFERAAFTRTPALQFFDENGTAILKTDALVLRQRMLNSMLYVLERAHEKGMTFQRFARSKGLEKPQKGN